MTSIAIRCAQLATGSFRSVEESVDDETQMVAIYGDVDLKTELWGEVFELLKNPEVFRRFQLDEELNTLTWPSGADFAPEFLYERAAAQQADAADRPSTGH